MMKMHRYHPLTILFDLASFVKSFGLLFILVIVNINSDSWLARIGRMLLLAAFILTILSSILKWFIHKYATDELAFYLRTGIFDKTERTVYYDKIQNVQRHTSFLHKVFGVTSVTFETGTSGMNSNIKFDVLKKAEAERLEMLVKEFSQSSKTAVEIDNQSSDELPTQAERVVHFTPTRKDTIKASFTSFSFLIILVIGASIFSKLNQLFDVEQYVEGWLADVLTSPWLIAGIIVVLIMLAVTIGIVWTFIKYGKYEIASDAQRVYISKGVLDESAFSIPKSRVQGVEITQSFMKRILGLAEVKLISAGDLGDDEKAVSTLYPFLPVKRAYLMITELLPNFEVSKQSNRLPKKSLAVRLLKPYWFWLVVTVLLSYFRPEVFNLHYGWLLVSISFLLLLVTFRVINYWHTTYVITNDFIQMSTGAFEKVTFLTRREKIIEVSIERTKLQQLTGLATIELINRAKPVRHESLKDVTIEEAKRFYQWYATRKVHIE